MYVHDDFSWLFIEGIFLTAHKVSLCMSQLVFILSFWFYYHQRRLAPSHSLSSNSRGSYTHTFCDFHNKGSCFYESAPHRADFFTLGKFQFSNTSQLEFLLKLSSDWHLNFLNKFDADPPIRNPDSEYSSVIGLPASVTHYKLIRHMTSCVSCKDSKGFNEEVSHAGYKFDSNYHEEEDTFCCQFTGQTNHDKLEEKLLVHNLGPPCTCE